MSGFVPLPGSDAEAAVKAIQSVPDLTIDNFDASVAPIWEKYNIDPVTAEAVSETAHNVMSTDPNANMSTVASDLVGRTVADPSVAGNNAREAVHQGSEGMSPSQQAKLAVDSAGDAAESAGADRATAESKAQEALDNGASPEMAAESAATAAASEALISNPASFDGVSGFDIMGYLKAMVQGVVIETNLSTETQTVKGETWWNIDGAFVQTTANELTINCQKYHAEASTDISESPVGMNFYLKGYEMYSPNPFTFSGLSLAGSIATASAYGFISSLGVVKTTVATRDLYLVGASMGAAQKQFQRSHAAIDRALVRIHIARGLQFLGGNPSPAVKSAAGKLGNLAKGIASKVKKKNKGP
ncbi:MAG TPA: hypothetical protein VEA17_06375 [Bordetella sp.]|nr:hypothetical protein [Bordetella sp.]